MPVPFRIGVLQLSMEPLDQTVRMAKACDQAGFEWLVTDERAMARRQLHMEDWTTSRTGFWWRARNNPGGVLDAAVEVSDAFLDSGTIVSADGRTTESRFRMKAEPGDLVNLLGPVYDVQQLGIDVVASPRHADGIVVTGPVTGNMLLALRKTWEATPAPRLLIAVGACAISGGPFKQGYNVLKGIDRYLPVDVHIPGCPPRPEALIYALMKLQDKIAAERHPIINDRF